MRHEMPQLSAESPVSGRDRHDDSAQLSLTTVIGFLRRNRGRVLLSGITGALIAMAYVLSVPPSFRTQATVVLDYRSPAASGEARASDAFDSAYVDTQVILMQSDDVLGEVIQSLGLASDTEFNQPAVPKLTRLIEWIGRIARVIPIVGTAFSDVFQPSGALRDEVENRGEALKQLKSALRVTRVGRSYVGEVEVTSKDPQKAARIANAVAGVYIDYQTRARMQAAERETMALARILSPAMPPTERNGLKLPVMLGLGFVAGLGGGISVCAARAVLRRTVRSSSEIEAMTGQQCVVMGAIRRKGGWRLGRREPGISDPEALRYAIDYPGSRFSEGLRLLRSEILSRKDDPVCSVVGFASPLQSRTRSEIAANFAQMLAESGENVLLVDAEFRLRLLTQSLSRTMEIAEDSAVLLDPQTNLAFLPLVGAAAEAAYAQRPELMRRIVEQARAEYSWICVDLPPLAASGDAPVLMAPLDWVVLLAECEKTEIQSVQIALRRFGKHRRKCIGLLLASERESADPALA